MTDACVRRTLSARFNRSAKADGIPEAAQA